MASVDIVVVFVADSLLMESIVHFAEQNICCLSLLADSFSLADFFLETFRNRSVAYRQHTGS
jgi:hypothetical protein